jgi:hypothetical protein
MVFGYERLIYAALIVMGDRVRRAAFREGESSFGFEGIMKYIFLGTVLVSICALLLMTFHYFSLGTFSLSSDTGTVITLPGFSGAENKAYVSSAIPSYVSTKFQAVKQTGYTVSFDVFLASAQNTGAYRIVFYNGSQIRDPGRPLCAGTPPPVGCDSSTGKYLTSTVASGTGLQVDPKNARSIVEALERNNTNIFAYISPDVNDMYIAYFTESNLRESTPIKNVPIGTPFRVTLAVDPNFIETYINGDLVTVTKTPEMSQVYTYTDAGAINFMGSAEFSTYCKTGNFQYWNQVLPAKSIRLFSSTPAAKTAYTS